ncbi:PREDICTED: tRNA (guanine(37)-N1)-methyltransferase [Polistes canadensis]|uniref:tRNA (guanine(37)-N1)-methyltransferase n=1 Tax=Polistes canadensis TaxID=91411 RepID=UPI000718DDB1|nr:PREDICTED: tRNA (guanine(37)-N1)-methyltransferase [Polistes canadensis]XP_014599191.1 PREDICTED: tRNA (guanine(37)-N1)-methyltransferase [Polistes canadensis]
MVRPTVTIRGIAIVNQLHCFNKTTMTSLLVPPVSVRGMKCLDRDAFTTTIEIPSLKLCKVKFPNYMPILKKYLLKLHSLKPVQNVDDLNTIVYLNPNIVKKFEDIDEADRKLLKDQYEYSEKTQLTLKYENWKSEDILKSILPEDIETPMSFSQIGHIVHLNLRDTQLPYKNIIGQVFLDKIPTARTVVNKTKNIDTTFRHFTMEILAGDENTITTVKENGRTYQFDFAQVYWNPRLSTEHMNLLTFMENNDVLYDVFAGVGPFAIPAARKKVRVLANDLNPESYKWLQKNADINKIKRNFQCFNLDGRDFLRDVVKTDILNRRENKMTGKEHIAMNLPASAVEFLDIFPNLFSPEEIEKVSSNPPIIHLYCFVKLRKNENPWNVAILLVENKLGCKLYQDSLVDVHNVRNVSPKKEMMRVSFLLTENILKGEEPAMKKPKLEECTDSCN